MRKKITIQKDSNFISIYASGELTVTQKKIYNCLIYVTRQMLHKDNERTKFEISLQDLMNFISEKDLNYVHIVDNLRALKHIIVEYNVLGKNKRNRIDIFNLLGDVRIENGIVYYDFGFISLEYIKQPQTYAYLDLKVMQGLNTKHSISLYEIMQDYKGLKIVELEIEKLKKSMDIKKEQYQRFNTFNQEVLDPSIADINSKTDLKISYEKITKGRKVVALKFNISENKEYKKESSQIENKYTNNEQKPQVEKTYLSFEKFILYIQTFHQNEILTIFRYRYNGEIINLAISYNGDTDLLYDYYSKKNLSPDFIKGVKLWELLYEEYLSNKLKFQSINNININH